MNDGIMVRFGVMLKLEETGNPYAPHGGAPNKGLEGRITIASAL